MKNYHSYSLISLFLVLIISFSCKDNTKSIIEYKAEEFAYNRQIWPEPKPHEIEVMILGVYHMSNPRLDANNVDSDDVRAEKRQKELRELSERLIAFKPDVIATEIDYKSQGTLHSLYTNIPIDTLLKTRKNEIIQIGFRLGKLLNHNTVYGIDYPIMLGNDSLTSLSRRYKNGIPHKIKYPGLKWKQINKTMDSLLTNSTITEFLIEMNKEQNLIKNNYAMFGNLRKGENDNFGGPQNLAIWYERNFKMVHNIYRACRPDTKKVLLIVGSGHVSPLRHILDDAPMFCPVSPIPFLLNNQNEK